MNDHLAIEVCGVRKRYGAHYGVSVLSRALVWVPWIGKAVAARTSSPLDGRYALDGVDLRVAPGETVGVIGGNGSGKTTLLKTIAGMMRPTEGAVTVRGEALYASGFGGAISRNMTVLENLRVLAAAAGLSARARDAAIPRILRDAELEGYGHTRAGVLSDGTVSRLSFFALMGFVGERTPAVLLLDETISAGGDERFRQRALAAVERCTASGAAVLLVTHSLSVVESHCSRAIWLDRGRVRMEGPARSVVSAYREEATKSSTTLVG